MRKLNHLPLSVRVPIEEDNPGIVRWEEKCIRCGMCRTACTNLIGVHGTYTLEETGGKAICIYCGQCANVCPVDSITERDESAQVKKAIADPEKIVVVSTSPAVRAALGEEFGMEPGAFVEGKMVALLRALGADYVPDTNFAADLTIVEEASELIRRITEKGPVFSNSILDENGKAIGFEEEEEQVEADSTIISISQGPRRKLIRTTVGLEGSDRGLLIVDENGMTTKPGVFAAGDVTTGSKTVVHAVEGAKIAAMGMIRYMEEN